jgi:hypothetical protein
MSGTLETQSLTGEPNRGSPLRGTFNEAHIPAIAQAICEYHHERGTDGHGERHPRSLGARETAWTNFKAGEPKTKTSGLPMTSSAPGKRFRWKTTLCSGHRKKKYRASRCG